MGYISSSIEEGIRFSGAGVTGRGKMSEVGAGNWTLVLLTTEPSLQPAELSTLSCSLHIRPGSHASLHPASVFLWRPPLPVSFHLCCPPLSFPHTPLSFLSTLGTVRQRNDDLRVCSTEASRGLRRNASWHLSSVQKHPCHLLFNSLSFYFYR